MVFTPLLASTTVGTLEARSVALHITTIQKALHQPQNQYVQVCIKQTYCIMYMQRQQEMPQSDEAAAAAAAVYYQLDTCRLLPPVPPPGVVACTWHTLSTPDADPASTW